MKVAAPNAGAIPQSSELLALPQWRVYGDFIERCRDVSADIGQIDRDVYEELQQHKLKRCQRRLVTRDAEAHWYASVDAGAPDWSVYAGDAYLAEAWVCWKIYSRKYLHELSKPGGFLARLPVLSSIVDLGCGLGYTTAVLRELFPMARSVVGTNLPDTKQWAFATRLGKEYGFSLRSSLLGIGGVDLVFASEYFEHFEEPLRHLRDVLTQLRPKILITANTFTGRSVGHFNRYLCPDTDQSPVMFAGRDVSHRFNRMLRESGYAQVPVKHWNNRPTVWHRGE